MACGEKGKVLSGVEVVEDGNITHFRISDDVKREEDLKRKMELEEFAKRPSSFFRRLLDWFRKSPVTPYVKVSNPYRDMSIQPFDHSEEIDSVTGVEVGVKVRF